MAVKTNSIAFLILITILSACSAVPQKPYGRAISSESPSLPWATQNGIEIVLIDGTMMVSRANPSITPLELINMPDSSAEVAQIAARRNLSLVTNAAMFAQDYKTSIGYMRNFELVNNPNFSSKMRGFLMFNPKNPTSPAVRIGGKEEITAYNTVFQTHRMWSATEGILWKKGASIYHHVGLVGVDGKNRILFFHQPNLTDVHDMVERILELNLDLKGLLYLDGGNHGTLFLSPELGRGWNTRMSLPNLLGIKKPAQ